MRMCWRPTISRIDPRRFWRTPRSSCSASLACSVGRCWRWRRSPGWCAACWTSRTPVPASGHGLPPHGGPARALDRACLSAPMPIVFMAWPDVSPETRYQYRAHQPAVRLRCGLPALAAAWLLGIYGQPTIDYQLRQEADPLAPLAQLEPAASPPLDRPPAHSAEHGAVLSADERRGPYAGGGCDRIHPRAVDPRRSVRCD